MAIEADVSSFRSRFPEFSAVADGTINTFLEYAKTQIDTVIWSVPDEYALGLLYLTAHHVSKYNQIQANISSSAAVSGTGATDLFVQSVSFTDRSISFGRRTGDTDSRVGALGVGERGLDDSLYGQMFLSLRSKIVFPIAVV